MPYQIIDTHTHLCDPVFDGDRGEVLEKSRNAGVSHIIIVSENMTDARKNLDLARRHPELVPAAGLYPTHLDFSAAEEMMALIRKEKKRLAAIGEVGLDHWAVKEAGEREIQQQIFGQFIDLSIALDLPLNVHSRSAGRHAVSLLLQKGARRVQMHAFDGKYGAAMPAVEAGFFFSIPPSIARSRQKQKLVKQMPLSCLLVETDSPVLGPDPSLRNKPANAVVSVEMIAEIKGLHPEAVTEAVFENTHRLYGKKLFKL